MNRLLISLAVGSVLAVSSIASAQDQARSDRFGAQALPAHIQSLKLDSPVRMGGADAASAMGGAAIVLRFKEKSLGWALAAMAIVLIILVPALGLI